MKIHGLQKLTLLDYPGRLACTVFLGGCDFRCPFCHNSELLDMSAPALMESSELLHFLKGRQGILDGVAITGGEPLLRPDLAGLIRDIRDLGFAVKLDTNGFRPKALAQLLNEGLLDYIAMDIKNSPERYAATAGLPSLDLGPIRESIALITEGGTDYEFRTTVVREYHDEASFPPIADMIRGAKKYYLQCFTERDSVLKSGLSAPSAAELERYAELVRPAVQLVSVRGIG